MPAILCPSRPQRPAAARVERVVDIVVANHNLPEMDLQLRPISSRRATRFEVLADIPESFLLLGCTAASLANLGLLIESTFEHIVSATV